ncbi:MAG: alkylmercury lyase family protein [Streptosporangiaceae bacterium]
MEIVTACNPQWAAAGTAAQQAVLPDRLRRLHQAVLVYFLDHGDPPGRPWLNEQAGRLGLDPPAAYADLAAADLVHLDQAGQVAVAYPFSGIPTGHRVQLADAPPVWAMCAIDALGIPQMTGRDGTVTAADPHSGDPVRVEVTGRDWRWNPPGTTVLMAQAGTCDSSALCSCPHVNFFTSADHARCYLASHPELAGQLLDQHTAVELADMVFGMLLHPVGGEDQPPATIEP